MERKRILIAARIPRDFQELRSALLTAGYEVRTAADGVRALSLAQEFRPHLVLSEIELPKIDGHHLLRELKSHSLTSMIPFALISHHRAVEERVRSIDAGVDEYITTPFDVKEVVLRIEVILKEVEQFENSSAYKPRGFFGKLAEINLIELLQILKIGCKSGLIKIQNQQDDEGLVLMREGEVLHAATKSLNGEQAVIRMFFWEEGNFQVELRTVNQAKSLKASTEEMISKGFVLRDRWQKWASLLPPLQTRIQPGPNFNQGQLQDYEKSFLKDIRENATLREMIEGSHFDDLKALECVARMFRTGRIMEADFVPDTDHSDVFPSLSGNGMASVSRIVSNFFGQSRSGASKSSVERRLEQRRRQERRTRNRRQADYGGESTHNCLTKSELIMIREKLANGVGTMTKYANENR